MGTNKQRKEKAKRRRGDERREKEWGQFWAKAVQVTSETKEDKQSCIFSVNG